MTGLADGAEQYAALARRLKEAGETGLGRQLRKALNDAAQPITRKVTDPGHLHTYLPDHYADAIAADLKVTTLQRGSMRRPGVRIQAQGRAHKRKDADLNEGILHHPRFGDREHWYLQLRGMRAGFFSDPCTQSRDQVRDKILGAMAETAAKIRG
jgi:hypothetical protein